MQGNFLIRLDDGSGINSRLMRLATLLARVALAAAFLSAVADRFGVWGPPGAVGVAWGNLEHFNAYVAKLNWFLPPSLSAIAAWTATVAEAGLAVGLLVGWQLRWTTLLSALLLFLFGLAMAIALGPKAPLDYSVFTAATAAFLLFALQPSKPSVKPYEES